MKELVYKVSPHPLVRGFCCVVLAFAAANLRVDPGNVRHALISACFTIQAILLIIPGKLTVRYDHAMLELSGVKKLTIKLPWNDVLIEQDDQESRIVKDRRTGAQVRIMYKLLRRILKDTGHEDLWGRNGLSPAIMPG